MTEHVKPSRDDIARAIDALDETVWMEGSNVIARLAADAVLALLPGRTEAEVKAEALREAAAELVRAPQVDYVQPTVWLHARAYGLEQAERHA